MIDHLNSNTWRMRDGTGVVHWLRRGEVRASVLTQCGWSCASLYLKKDPRVWDEQLVLTSDVVTCMECMITGPYAWEAGTDIDWSKYPDDGDGDVRGDLGDDDEPTADS